MKFISSASLIACLLLLVSSLTCHSGGDISPIPRDQLDSHVSGFMTDIGDASLSLGKQVLQIVHLDIDNDVAFLFIKDRQALVQLDWDPDTMQPVNGGDLYVMHGPIPFNLEKLSFDDMDAIEATVSSVTADDAGVSLSADIHNGSDEQTLFVQFPYELQAAGDVRIDIAEQGTRMTLQGELGYRAYTEIRRAINQYPNLKTIDLLYVPGSLSDEINTYTGELIRQAGLDTYVPANGLIASGGVDLFAAGVHRVVQQGAQLGVHSWCCDDDGRPADAIPDSDPAHNYLVNYLSAMMGKNKGRAFYYFTIHAAPFEGTHFMSTDEMTDTGLVTELR